MLKFDHVTLRRGPRVLFADADFSLFRAEKVGITGENGSGKSSLLSLVRGELQPDAGHFSMPGNLEVAHVAQELDATDQPSLDFVLDGDAALRAIERRIATLEAEGGDGSRLAELYAEYAAAGGYDARARAARLMHGLGFAPTDEARPLRDFSGGWRVRLNVARALMCRSDLLLLDEPTNHLDLDAILWLEGWLREYPGTLLLIAHDREFLDRVVNRVVNIEHGVATLYRGNYSDFETQRAAQLAQQSALYERQQREVRHMEAFVERFRAQATKARQAQSRIKALERMQRIAPAHVDSPFQFSFSPPAKLPRPLLAIEDQAVGYGDVPLVSGISLTVYPGDRIALLGRNGAGKSTVIKLLAGELPARGGTRTEARDLAIGYFAQHQLEQLDPEDSPLGNLRRTAQQHGPQALEQELRDYLASFGFRGDRVFEPVAPFSGGEKSRLALCLMAWRRPNLLLLDEPTNHLDLEMRQALVMALQDYAGAVVMVSHDRHLLRTVSDSFRIVHGGRVQDFDGDLEDYARWLEQSAAQAAPAAVAASGGNGAQVARESAEDRRQRKREEAGQRAQLAPLKAKVARHETEMADLARQIAALDEQLGDASLYEPAGKVRLLELTNRRAQLAQRNDSAETAWLTASEALEAAQAGLT
jgi:ATP-binding cassette, subfamily F, member 3